MPEMKPFEIIMRVDPYCMNNGEEICLKGKGVQELIRCKDCYNWTKEKSIGRKSLGTYRCLCQEWSWFEDGMYRYTAEDDFCSYAEREEE